MADMTREEADEHLAEVRVGHLVTLRRNGTPHVAPVWYQGDSERAWVMAGEGAVKVRNARRNPRVALSVATNQRPYKYVVLEGSASLGNEDLAERVRSICVRYDGPERGEEFAKELMERGDMVLLEISVDRLMSWVED